MDTNRFISLGNYSQPLETKEICILVANDDNICCNIVASMLKYCTYEVFKYDKERDTFNAMWGRKEGIEVVLTNIHRTEPTTTRFSIIDHIEKDFNVTTFLMSPDGFNKIESKGLAGGATVYYVKNMSKNVIKNIYINSLMEMKGKVEGTELVDSFQRSLISKLAETNNVSTFSSDEENWGTNMQKRKEQDDDNRDDSSVEKKPRIIWNDGMHKKFLDAIEQIGYEKAVPKKIIEVMNVPGLTREHIASHLQKHRIIRKQVQEKLFNFLNGKTLTDRNAVKAPSLSSSVLGISQQPSWRSYQIGSRNAISAPNFSGHSSIFSDKESTSNSRCRPGQAYNHFNYSSVMNFGKMQKRDQPVVGENQNFRFFYHNRTKNILSSIENRWSTRNLADNNAISSSTATSSSTRNGPYIGPRLANGGKSMEFGDFGNGGIRGETDFSAGGNFGNFVPLEAKHFGLENRWPVGNVIPLQESPPMRRLQISNIQNSLPPLLYNNGNDDDSDWTPNLEAIERLLEQEKSMPPLSEEMAWNGAAGVQQQPSENEASSAPPTVALPSESSSLRIYGGNCIMGNEAAAAPLLGFEHYNLGFDDGGLEALLQEAESTGPQLF